jgi:hypothetical protein
MKAAFTDIDIEAARLFKPAGGMLAGLQGQSVQWGRLRDRWRSNPDAFDTDDPATVGCMLAQFREAAGQPGARPVVIDELSENVWRPHWMMTVAPHRSVMATTEGGAIVSAMRRLKETP